MVNKEYLEHILGSVVPPTRTRRSGWLRSDRLVVLLLKNLEEREAITDFCCINFWMRNPFFNNLKNCPHPTKLCKMSI